MTNDNIAQIPAGATRNPAKSPSPFEMAYVYQTPPLDDWLGWTPVEDLIAASVGPASPRPRTQLNSPYLERFDTAREVMRLTERLWAGSYFLAKHTQQTDDYIAVHPRALPVWDSGVDGMGSMNEYIVALKMLDNGTTYMAARQPLRSPIMEYSVCARWCDGTGAFQIIETEGE